MWDEVLRNVEAFRRGTTRLGLAGSWDRPGVPVTVDIRAPAGEDAVRAVEAQIGEPIPPALRWFYRDVCAGLEIEWLIPGRRVVMPEGWSSVAYDLLPPPPFQQPSVTGPNPAEPVINAGHTRFFLSDAAREQDDMLPWIDNFQVAEAQLGGDPAAALHYRRYAEWWRRGFAIGRDMGGNVIAIDRQDESGRLLWLSHDGSDSPGWFIDHTLMEFLLIQSRLGWTGFRGIEFEHFRDGSAPPGDRERRYRDDLAGDGERAPLPPTTYRFDERNEDAKLWRRWLGLPEPA